MLRSTESTTQRRNKLQRHLELGVNHDVEAEELEGVGVVRDGVLRREQRGREQLRDAAPQRRPLHALRGEEGQAPRQPRRRYAARER